MKLFGTSKVVNNELNIGEVDATKLIEKYGSPLYVMDEALIRDNCRRYINAFAKDKNKVAYAGKAFNTLSMCRLVKEEGLCLDVVSGGELFTAYKSEFPLENIYFHGNNKTLEEISMGIELGVGRFVIDNFYEIDKINEIAKTMGKIQKIMLRITPGIEAHTHEYIKTGQEDSKFGFTLLEDQAFKAVEKCISLSNVELAGFHCHIGSQIFDVEPFVDEVKIMINIMKDVQNKYGITLKELDLGGGFGIYYTEEDEPKEPEVFCEAILQTAEEVCKEIGFDMPVLIIEPGRSIVANAGTTLYTVGSIKDVPGIRRYVAVDGGMGDNIRPALYQAKYECTIANKMDEDSGQKVTIAGKCCESGDILINDIEIGNVESGDILAMSTTGAYGFSMANNYNKIPRPSVVMVKDGEVKIAYKRETYEDLIRNEV
ncbi:diaminopimelate decarboxylase [Clostridium sediminicola]|uniref:diaminopimelate decarboxylase n=1 Tax=Clostridium sediminicola TaxID=3114879 RepID=UPI0031F1DAF9